MKHRIGNTIHISGEVIFGCESSLLFDWKASARIKGNGVDHVLNCKLEFDIQNEKTFITIEANPEEQIDWIPCIAAMDIRLESPDGFVINTVWTTVELVNTITTE